MDCLKCGVAEEFVKNGFARGKQRYKCKACGYQMTRLAPRGHPMKEKHLALVLYLSGLSMNMIAKIIGVSCQSVMVWIKKFAISVIPHFQRQSKDIIEFAKELQEKGEDLFEATLHAAKMRLRPIIMTTLAFGFGVLPLALASGAGAGSQHSVGYGVLGGVISSTLLGIFFIPVFFVWIRSIFKYKPKTLNTQEH